MALEKDAQKRIKKSAKGPRVVIGVDVDADDALPKKEVPFVLGVIAHLSGHADKPSFKEQVAHEIDRENFDAILAKIHPKLTFSVESSLQAGKNMGVELTFTKMEDFEPQRVAENVPTLQAKLRERQQLSDLLARLNSNGKLSARLQKAIENTEERKRLRSELSK